MHITLTVSEDACRILLDDLTPGLGLDPAIRALIQRSPAGGSATAPGRALALTDEQARALFVHLCRAAAILDAGGASSRAQICTAAARTGQEELRGQVGIDLTARASGSPA